MLLHNFHFHVFGVYGVQKDFSHEIPPSWIHNAKKFVYLKEQLSFQAEKICITFKPALTYRHIYLSPYSVVLQYPRVTSWERSRREWETQVENGSPLSFWIFKALIHSTPIPIPTYSMCIVIYNVLAFDSTPEILPKTQGRIIWNYRET